MLSEANKAAAIGRVCGSLRLRALIGTPPAERIEPIAEIVFAACDKYEEANNLLQPTPPLEQRRVAFYAYTAIEAAANYKELVSFIPLWIIGIALKIIVAILVDFWLLHRERAR